MIELDLNPFQEDIYKVLEDISKSQYIRPYLHIILQIFNGVSNYKEMKRKPYYRKYPRLTENELLEEIKDLSLKYKNITIKIHRNERYFIILHQNYLQFKNQTKEDNDLLFKRYNHEASKTFTKDDLLSLGDWTELPPDMRSYYPLKVDDDYTFTCASKEEYRLINKFKDSKFFKVLRGNNPIIKYRSSIYHNYRNYYPDVVMLTYDDRILFIEIKQVENFCNYINISKYFFLKKYCEENGFECVMMDRFFVTYEMIENMRINRSIREQFYEILNTQGYFSDEDINKIDHPSKKEKIINISAIIIQEGLLNTSKIGIYVEKNKFFNVNFLY